MVATQKKPTYKSRKTKTETVVPKFSCFSSVTASETETGVSEFRLFSRGEYTITSSSRQFLQGLVQLNKWVELISNDRPLPRCTISWHSTTAQANSGTVTGKFLTSFVYGAWKIVDVQLNSVMKASQ
ncbi:hypothetical protein HOLleu_33260 [Holothuria leucospilota]|uniref:Uncharacterized protein n=1 Tax=Holothuria leucospilota TaxID=206669 RepID=A0A9Q0YQ06_HOLLE|nr:hypothetical protein HOLleu_33260 [Holothuria leucospilota]